MKEMIQTIDKKIYEISNDEINEMNKKCVNRLLCSVGLPNPQPAPQAHRNTRAKRCRLLKKSEIKKYIE